VYLGPFTVDISGTSYAAIQNVPDPYQYPKLDPVPKIWHYDTCKERVKLS
jgi:hypothetical protein